MKLIFICGSLEEGKDGVGDYTRRLASELIKLGHEVRIIAIHDRLIKLSINGVQKIDGKVINVLRLPSILKWELRIELAKDYLNVFNPDRLCLEYVPFSFNKRGIPFFLASKLKAIASDRAWLIMFHELWLGMEIGASMKHIIWGCVQKTLIRSLVRKLNVKAIYTQSLLYLSQLKSLGLEPNLLPLFGNIPVINEEESLTEKNLSFVIFGGIHHGSDIISFAKELQEISLITQLKVEVIFVGRNGFQKEDWINVLENAKINFVDMGEQSIYNISKIFLGSTFGVTTTPYILTDKSGSVASMREHGLIIICLGRSWNVEGFQHPYGSEHLKKFEKGNLSALIKLKNPLPDHSSLVKVAKEFEKNL
ncbi:MAG: glycosyltransferase [Bacteroidota bacterium]